MEALQRVKLDGFQMVISELENEMDYLRRASRYLESRGHRPGEKMGVMFITCYKTNDPEQLPHAEYYNLYIRAEGDDESRVYYVDERHGWFDPAGKRAIDARVVYADGFPTWEEAENTLKGQLQYVVKNGYVHGFVHDPFAPNGSYYRKIDPDNL
jgi:hypothetical protein